MGRGGAEVRDLWMHILLIRGGEERSRRDANILRYSQFPLFTVSSEIIEIND